jgi:hypothetical protein
MSEVFPSVITLNGALHGGLIDSAGTVARRMETVVRFPACVPVPRP